MTTYFISDLHLSNENVAATKLFLRFLQEKTVDVEALYILGDFFEFWIGDDFTSPFTQKIIQSLKNYTSNGTPVYFLPGNRDFLLGKKFAAATGIKILADPCCHTIYNENIVLTHGDMLCMADRTYQYFRNFVQNALIKKLFLSLPLKLRLKIAQYVRSRSKQRYQLKQYNDTICQQKTSQLLKKFKAKTIIHGHTHEPCIHKLTDDCQRIVLGDWHDNAYIIQADKSQIKLQEYC